MNAQRLIQITAALSAAFTVGSVSAQTLADVGPTAGTATSYTLAYSNGSTGTGAYAPGRTMTWNGGSSFRAYCVDPTTGTDFSQAYAATTLDNFMNGASNSGYAQQISRTNYTNNWYTAGAAVGAPTGLSITSAAQTQVLSDLKELFSWAYNDSLTSATKAAAFGMAVWEIILQDGGPGSYSRTAGRLRVNGSTATSGDGDAVETQFNSYINALNGNSWTTLLGASATATNWVYTVYYDAVTPYSQSFIRVTTPSVPEPASLALVGLALAGVAVARRKARA